MTRRALTNNNQVVGIDLLRCAAALLVALYHLSFWSWAFPPGLSARASGHAIGPNAFSGLALYGWIGVEIFFVISGFVIAFSAEKATARSFLRSRILRLVPAVLVCAPVTAMAAILTGTYGVKHGALVVALSWLFPPYGPWPDSTYWTLPIEIVFYGTVLALLWLRRIDLLPAVAWLLAAVSGVYWAVPWGGAQDRTLDLLLMHHGCYFAAGIFLYRMRERSRPSDIVGLAVCALIGLAEIHSSTAIHVSKTNLPMNHAIAASIWIGAVATIFVSVRFNKSISTACAKYQRAGRMLGLATYPLYLIHNIVGCALAGILVEGGIAAEAAILITLSAVLALSCSIAGIAEPLIRHALRPSPRSMLPSGPEQDAEKPRIS